MPNLHRFCSTSHALVVPSRRGGRGVFARHRLVAGDLIERCPVLCWPLLLLTDFEHYFEWDEAYGAIALGVLSLANHSYEPNADYYFDTGLLEMTLVATRTIEVMEEVLINYNGDQDDRTPLWFDVVT